MWSDQVVVDIISRSPAVADDALKAVQHDLDGPPVDFDAIEAAAGVLDRDPAEFCVEFLGRRRLLAAFEQALRARDVDPDAGPAGTPAVRRDIRGLQRFLDTAPTSRCRVEVNGEFKGSGCLVGPGLVLTAWHVVRVKGPGIDQTPEPKVIVTLSDGSSHPAIMPPVYASPCGDSEWASRAPRADAEVQDRNDVALLALTTPAARHLGYVRLPTAPPVVTSRSRLYLLDFPLGKDGGLADGTASKIRNLTTRVRHDIDTASGSSGGVFFNERHELLGIHQGRIGKYGRLVPFSLFAGELVDRVREDVAPTEVWHLDGQTSQLVIGRDLFVSAVAEAGKEHTRVRGIRVRRRRPADSAETGLGFSYRILSELLLRRGNQHRIVTIPLDEPVSDLVADIARRVEAAGFPLPSSAAQVAAVAAPAGPDAAAREQASRLASAVDEAAAATGNTLWFFIDNPSVPLVESARLHLEGFVAASLGLPRIRLVVTGLETVPLAGLEFSSAAAATGDGPAGMVADYVGGFTRDDIRGFLTRAAEDLMGGADPEVIHVLADLSLHGLRDFNGEYESAMLKGVVATLQLYLEYFRERGRAAS